MKSSSLFQCSLFAVLSPAVFVPSAEAQQDALPDYIPVYPNDGGNDRWDYMYWSPSTGAMVPDWNANNWARFYGYEFNRGNPFPPTRYPTEARNEAVYAVFWDSPNVGPGSGFKTVDLDANVIVRGLHFRNQGWTLQDADGANTLTLISGTARPYHYLYSDDREAITLDVGSEATISANVVLGAFNGSTWTSTGTQQYIAMGAHSALTISGNITQTGAAKTLIVGRFDAPVGVGATLTLGGNNTFSGGMTFYSPSSLAYGATTTPRLNINSNQALGTGPLTLNGGPVVLGNTSGGAVTIANPLVLTTTTPGTTGNFYNSNVVVADIENLIYDSPHNLTLSSTNLLTLTGHRSIRVEDSGGDLILGGRILRDASTTSSLFKNGPGKLVLSGTDNTYIGVTQINGGILEVTKLADAGQPSSIGAGANTIAKNVAGIYGANVSTSNTTNSVAVDALVPGLLLSNGGTLRYVGSGDSTDRLIGLYPGRRAPADLVTTPVSIDASGTGALKFTNSGDVVHIQNFGDLFRVLNLTGTNTDDNTFNLALTDIANGSTLVRNQLTKSGPGRWILTGANTHTGGTTVYDGTLQLGDSCAVLADTGSVHVHGGTFRLGAANETIGSLGGSGGTVDLFNGSGRTLTLGGSADANYAGAIVGTGASLVKTGSATQTLSGANSYTGSTTIDAGTLQFARTSAFYGGTIDATTAARLGIAPDATAGFHVGGAGAFTSADLATLRANAAFAADSFLGLDPSNAPGGSFTYADNLDGTLGLAKLGTGTLVLGGANAYTGPTAVRAGTLAFPKTTAFYGGAIDGGTAARLTVASGATAQFNVGGAAEFTAPNLDVLLGGGGFAAGSTVALDTTHAAGGTFVYGSDLGGQFGLNKAGSGTLVLGGANTYAGSTTVSAGTLQLNDAGTSLPATADVIVKGGGTLRLGASDQTIGSLAGDGTVQLLNGTGRALTIHGGANATFAGTLAGSGGSLVKSGSGRQILSGANTYDGPTSITGGTLQFAKISAFYDGTLDATTADRLSVSAGSTAAFNVGGAGEFTSPDLGVLLGNGHFAAGSVLGLDTTGSGGGTFTHADNLGGDIGLAKLGTGKLVLSGANSYTGTTTVSGGTLQFAQPSAFYGGVIDSTTAAKLSVTSGSTIAFNYGGSGEFTQTQINTLRAGGAFPSGTLLGLDTTNAVDGVASYGPNAAVSHGLVKSGGGTLILTAPISSQANTFVLDGTLRFATRQALYSASNTPSVLARLSVAPGATATMSVGSGALDFTAAQVALVMTNAKFAPGSTLGLHTNTDFAYDAIIEGAFRLGKFGDNTLTLNSVNLHTGGTLVAGGTLQLGVDDALGRAKPAVTVAGGTLALGAFKQRVGAFTLESGSVTGAGTLAGLGTLTADSFDVRSGSITANLAGPGPLTKSGSGTVTFSGTNSYNGPTQIAGGTLQLGVDHSLPSTTAVAVSSGATLNLADFSQRIGSLAGSGNVTLGAGQLEVGSDHFSTTFSGGVSGLGGRLVKIGAGTLTLNGTNTYTGPTTVTAGKLELDGTLASDVTVRSGATLGGGGQTFGGITLEAGSTLAPVGSLEAGSLTWNSGAAFVFTLGAAGSSDLLALGGDFTKSGVGSFAFTFVDAGWVPGQTYTLVSFGGTSFVADDFSYTNDGGFRGVFSIQDGTLAFTLGAIPEPGACGLLAGAGALAMTALRRRRTGVGPLAKWRRG